MRCASCGFPLSPARTSCPRCGAEVAKRKNGAEATQASPQGGFGSLEAQARPEAAEPQWFQGVDAAWTPDESAEAQWDQIASAPWTSDGPTDPGPAIPPFSQADNSAYGQQLFSNANAATFADQLPFPGNEIQPSATISTAEPEGQAPFWQPGAPMAATPLPKTDWAPGAPPHANIPPTKFNAHSRPSEERASFLASKLTPRFGFTISGAFIGTGTLLLIFVFLMSLSLPPSSSISSSQTAQLSPTAMSTQNTPTASQTVAPDPTTSPTADASAGKQFIDNVQTASTINTTTATAIQVTTRFKVRQQIYVTFAVHASQSGMVCLLWFLNGQQFDHYEFAMSSVSTPAYSYTTATSPGSGYIQIYWATKPDCSDKVLARQANFTVTA